ncbi:MAG: PEP/pyruvate-binding domain-containing protein [Mycobacterium leprae]
MQILPLIQVTRLDLTTAGGKGANLGEMARLGLPVPPGFVVSAQAYAAEAARLGLADRLTPLLARQEWQAAAETAAALFRSEELESTLQTELIQAYRALGSPAVAVRSSATAEDLADASFAGQQESLLNVQGEIELEKAVRQCWASLWSPRALHYRAERGIDHLQVTMAVVVQEMVAAEVAGVLFTVDPVAERADRMLAEAAPGLGEAVVSGQVTGDSYRIDRGGGALAVADRDLRRPGHPVLTNETLLALARIALRLEEHYGCPQDVEFAEATGRLYLLQTRPITTLAAMEPEPVPPLGRLTINQRVTEALSRERYPLAPRPLDNLFVGFMMSAAALNFRQTGWTVSPAEEERERQLIWREAMVGPAARPTWRLFAVAGLMRRLLDRDWQGWWENGPRAQLVKLGDAGLVDKMTDAELLARADEIRTGWEGIFRQRFIATAAYMTDIWLKALVVLAVGPRRATMTMADLLAGVKSATSETNQALWQLSRVFREHEAAEAEAQLAQFLATYGHRDGAAWYVSEPVWRRAPDRVRQMLQGLVMLDAPPSSMGQQQYEKARRLVEGRLRWLPGLPRFFRWLVERFRALQAFRENSHFDLTRPLAALQDLAAEWGRRLADRGLLASPGDVYYLTFDEVKEWLSGHAPPQEEARRHIARRQATYRLVNGRYQARLFKAASGGSELKGAGASSGVVRAKARIVRDESEFGRLRPGEVLVCPYSNPSWTPLFATAAAVVTETGGAMSHAAIVAREYGIPAVMGVAGATRFIADGQELLVDGNTGRVRIAR